MFEARDLVQLSENSAGLARYRRVLRGSAALSVLMVAMSLGGQAHAQNVWAGGDGIWTDASKWSFGVPAAGQTANVGLPGTVLIDNAAAEAGRVRVGGDAHLNVLGGGTLTTTLLSSVGYGPFGPGTGTMLIDGAGSKWIAQSGIRVGEGTGGALTVSNGGALDISGASLLSVGTGAGGNGVLNINNGSVVNAAAALRLGYNGATGTVNITNGGTLSTSVTGATDNNIGDGTSGTAATGEVNISGAGSSWTIGSDGELSIGRLAGSEGTLNIRDGGKLTFQNDSAISVGFQGGTGNVLVTGTGSTIDSSGGFAVANTAGSKGKVEVINGGLITADHGVVVGREAGAEAELTIANGGTVTAGTAANIAEAGAKGTVHVTGEGSKLEAATIAIGLDAGSEGKLTVADGATIKATEIFVGGNGGTAILNIGDGAAAGNVDADAIAMRSASSTINFNHNEANYAFDVEINDGHAAPTSGAVNFLGTGTTTLTAVNGYTAATNINAGRLVIAEGASIANSSLTTVNDKATLAGAGTVGDVDVKAGGTISPTALKTLTVKDIKFADGSTYQVAVNAAGGTSSIAADTAALNGTVRVAAGSGNYAAGTAYTILTTTNAAGVTGTFDNTVVSDFAFLNAALTYDPNKVNLALTRNTASFASVGLTANQRAVGRGFNSADVTSPVYGAVVQQNAAGARLAFDALSGEAHASNKAALVSNALLISDTIGRRAADPRDKAAAPVRAWAQGFGNWMDRGSDGNAAKLDSTTGGFVSGIDTTVSSWRLGAAAGYSQTDTDVSARRSSLETESYHLSVYGATRQGPYNLLFGGVYSWNDISSDRTVAFQGFSEALRGSYEANTAQVFGEANVRFPLGSAIIEPFAGFSYINHETDAFSENGGSAALRVAGDDFSVTFTTVGLRPSIALGQGLGFAVTGRGTVAWRHAFGDVDTGLSASVAGSSVFQVAGVPITEDALLLEAGIDVDVARNASVGLSWSGQFGDDATDNQLKGQILYRW
jgi:outer membrane autotransporter protein